MTEQEKTKVAGVADFVICLDITGSMSDCIENLKKNLKSFVSVLTAPIDVEKQSIIFKVNEWKGRLLPFRDLEEDPDGQQIFEDFPFVADVDALRAQIDDPRVVADFGGDLEESSLDAIYRAAMNSSWPERGGKKSNRFIILFTDAPPRPDMSTKTIAVGPRGVEEVVQALRGRHIMPVIFGPEGPEYQAILQLAKERGASDASQLFPSPGAAEAFFNSESKFEELMKVLAKELSTLSSENVL